MRYSALLVCACLIAGCQSVRWTHPPQKLAGTSWRAEMIGGSEVSRGIDSTLEIDTDAAISGYGGCNPYVSEVTVDSRSIRFGEILAAEMSCEPARSEQEQRFFSALRATYQMRMDRDRLVLADEKGATVLRLTRLPLGYQPNGINR